MLTFLIVALLIYGSMHLYALGKLWMAVPHSPALAAALIAAGVVLTLSPLLVWHLERHGWHRAVVPVAWASYMWMGYLLLFLSIGLLFDLGHLLSALLPGGWPLSAALEFRVIALTTLLALGYGLTEANHIRVERVTLHTPKLAGQVTLAQLSDLHLGIMHGDAFLDRIVAHLRELKPDLVVATGDIVDGQGDDFDELARHFRSYTPPLGAYAVIGNHEVYAGLASSLRFLGNAGFTVLRGAAVRTDRLVLAGVDDPAVAAPGQPARLNAKLMPGMDHAYTVLLKHQPVTDRDTPFDLQLSGHIHGGQIFPFGYLTWLSYHVHTGLTELGDGRTLYVSRGAGTWGPPLRLFAPPEITLITLVGTGRPAAAPPAR